MKGPPLSCERSALEEDMVSVQRKLRETDGTGCQIEGPVRRIKSSALSPGPTMRPLC